ncbi:MAG: hypothetical protein BJ554DRAFT_6574, partial [Olpidium bornovanus]
MDTRANAIQARKADRVTINDTVLKIGWSCGFGPKDIFDYINGASIIPLARLTDADRRWLTASRHGGFGARPIHGGVTIEEPDVIPGTGMASGAKWATPGAASGEGPGRGRIPQAVVGSPPRPAAPPNLRGPGRGGGGGGGGTSTRPPRRSNPPPPGGRPHGAADNEDAGANGFRDPEPPRGQHHPPQGGMPPPAFPPFPFPPPPGGPGAGPATGGGSPPPPLVRPPFPFPPGFLPPHFPPQFPPPLPDG